MTKNIYIVSFENFRFVESNQANRKRHKYNRYLIKKITAIKLTLSFVGAIVVN